MEKLYSVICNQVTLKLVYTALHSIGRVLKKNARKNIENVGLANNVTLHSNGEW